MVDHIITQKWLFVNRESKTYLPSVGQTKEFRNKNHETVNGNVMTEIRVGFCGT
jgi:hypothetical protein